MEKPTALPWSNSIIRIDKQPLYKKTINELGRTLELRFQQSFANALYHPISSLLPFQEGPQRIVLLQWLKQDVYKWDLLSSRNECSDYVETFRAYGLKEGDLILLLQGGNHDRDLRGLTLYTLPVRRNSSCDSTCF